MAQALELIMYCCTCPQDYLGTYIPDAAGGFTARPGPLTQALRQGAVLLIDELNLAPPAVTSMLGPLLDGATTFTSPITGQVEPVAPGFRIIATGNSALYAGRHALPLSLRSRFQVCVPVCLRPGIERLLHKLAAELQAKGK